MVDQTASSSLVDVNRATFTILDCCVDFERAIRATTSPQEALVMSQRIRQVLHVLQQADLFATNRMLALCGLPGE